MTDSNNLQSLSLRDRLEHLSSPIIIGVAGDSGSGKTTYSNGIRRLLGADLVETICTDGYHKEDREQRKKSGRLPLDPQANHLDLLADHLRSIKQNQDVEIPIYSHETGRINPPVPFSPTPIVVVEGLHALYPECLEWLDFTIYVDPNHEIKWQWKWQRDIERRGHKAESLEAEMTRREAAYKRWIDFQKTSAMVTIKIFPSQIEQMARHRLKGKLGENRYKVELIVQHSETPLPRLDMPLDLATMLDIDQAPLLIATIPSCYWGKDSIAIHIDGEITQRTVRELESYITGFTGIPIDEALPCEAYEQVSATRFTQLIIAWRFLEEVNGILARP
jgi:phosphoribulokinase